MQVLRKSDIANSILMEYLGEFSVAKDKISYFIKKYKMTFNRFEKKVLNAKREEFAAWDDYIEWKGYNSVYNDLDTKIKDIKRGHFKVT